MFIGDEFTINYQSTAKKAPIYKKYQQQQTAQDAYIEIDVKSRSVRASWNAEIGNAVPFSVFYGFDRRYWIPNNLNGDEINALLDDIAPLAERICDGAERHWDGNNNVCRLNANAEAAEEELMALLPDDGSVDVWDVSDYLFANCSLIDYWCRQSLDEAVTEVEDMVDNNVALDGDIRTELIERAKYEFPYIMRNQFRELWKIGEFNYADAREWIKLNRLRSGYIRR